MKKYECLYIVNINFDSEGTSAVVARVEAILKNVGAEVVNTQHWGKRKLAYAIDKERYGNYVLLHFQGENPNLSEFHREAEIEKGVLHYMTIRLDDFPDFEKLSVPQAYETDRRRPAYGSGGRKPGRYDDRSKAESPVAGDSDKVEDAKKTPEAPVEADESSDAKLVKEEPAEVEKTEAVEQAEEVAPVTEEVTESTDEPVKEEADKSADAE